MQEGLIQPTFIDVDDAVRRRRDKAAGLQQRQHSDGVLLAKYQATLRVRLNRHCLRKPIPKAQLLPHYVADQLVSYFLASLLLDSLAYLFRTDDCSVGAKHLGHHVLDGVALLLLDLHSLA